MRHDIRTNLSSLQSCVAFAIEISTSLDLPKVIALMRGLGAHFITDIDIVVHFSYLVWRFLK